MNCIGHEFLKDHKCNGWYAWNHTLINRKKFQGVHKNRDYFDAPINMSWCCQNFHSRYGETTAFRQWFYERQCRIHGKYFVDAWLDGAPLKIKERYT